MKTKITHKNSTNSHKQKLSIKQKIVRIQQHERSTRAKALNPEKNVEKLIQKCHRIA